MVADESPPSGPPVRLGRWSVLAKVAVSLGLLVWLLLSVDRAALATRLEGAAWGWLVLGFVVKSLTVPWAALRWRAVGAMVGLHFGRIDALRLTFAALFLGQVLPGAVGGDIVRGWLTTRMGFAVSATIFALVIDRVAALLGVTVLMLAGLPHLLALAPAGTGAMVVLAALAVGGGTAALCVADRFPLPRFLRRPPVEALRGLVARMRSALGRTDGGLALGWSLLVHVCTILATAVFAHALGIAVSIGDCLAVVPFSIVAAALPISLAGWGVRESSMAAGFALLGVPAADGIAVSLLIGVSVLLMSLPGALVWLLWRPKVAPVGAPAQPSRSSNALP